MTTNMSEAGALAHGIRSLIEASGADLPTAMGALAMVQLRLEAEYAKHCALSLRDALSANPQEPDHG